MNENQPVLVETIGYRKQNAPNIIHAKQPVLVETIDAGNRKPQINYIIHTLNILFLSIALEKCITVYISVSICSLVINIEYTVFNRDKQ